MDFNMRHLLLLVCCSMVLLMVYGRNEFTKRPVCTTYYTANSLFYRAPYNPGCQPCLSYYTPDGQCFCSLSCIVPCYTSSGCWTKYGEVYPNITYKNESWIGLWDGYGLNTAAFPQEGRSFCINAHHFMNSSLSHWDRFEGMHTLLKADLDIGTHIHPADYAKMNAIRPNNSDFLREKSGELGGVDCTGTDARNRPATQKSQPAYDCLNPYKVQVTEIVASGVRLHNWLHIKVHADAIKKQTGVINCPTGKIKYLLLEVRDQGGLPVGEFTDEVPCEEQSKEGLVCPPGLTCRKYMGSRNNSMPCMFTPLRAILAPEIFMMSMEGEIDDYVTEVHATWKFSQHTSSLITELHFAALVVEDTSKLRYFTGRIDEFTGESVCLSLTELNKDNLNYKPAFSKMWVAYEPEGCRIQTMDENAIDKGVYCQPALTGGATIRSGSGEDPSTIHPSQVEPLCREWTQNNSKIIRPLGGGNWFACYRNKKDTDRIYGYTPQYTILRPTLKTLGAPDFFRAKYIRPDKVDCISEILEESGFYDIGEELKGTIPMRKDFLTRDHERVISRRNWYGEKENSTSGFLKKKVENFTDQDPVNFITVYDAVNEGQPITTYFGTRHTKYSYRDDYNHYSPNIKAAFRNMTTLSAQIERCPCPKMPTTVPPEFATRPPIELEGVKSHVIQNLIAWVLLVPIGLFSARYFKETYSKVFFLQEFWWFSIHLLCLLTALMFMMGGIYTLEIRRRSARVWTTETFIHVATGAVTMILYTIHLVVGWARAANLNLRLIQIILHWLFGMIEYFMAVATIFLSSTIPQSYLNCGAFYSYMGFLIFQIILYAGMEIHLRVVDRYLHLNPRRMYLPPPVMRVFHKNAPYSKFRMLILLIYCIVCLAVYSLIHMLISQEGGERSCHQKERERASSFEV